METVSGCAIPRLFLDKDQTVGLYSWITTQYKNGIGTFSRFRHMTDKDLLDKINTIRLHPAYGALSDEVLAQLAEKTTRIHFDKGAFIFHQGDPSDYMYIMESGRVIVAKNAPSGKMFTFVVGLPGVTLNAVTCFKGRPRYFSARAVEDTILLAASSEAFTGWVVRHPRVVIETMDSLGTLLDGAYNRIMDLLDESVEQRIVNTLTMLCSRIGRDLPFTNRELAHMAGTSRETVARVISRLQTAGLINKSRSRIEIADPERLKALTGSHEFLI